MLEESGEIAVVHRTMLKKYDVTPDLLETDLLRLAREMKAKGLLPRLAFREARLEGGRRRSCGAPE